MTDKETAKQFFENVIYKAAQMTGDTSGILPVIQKFMRENGIEEGTASIEELNRKHQNKELENEKEKAAAELAALGAAYATADQSKRHELIEGIQKEFETLKKTVTAEQKTITSKELMKKTFPPRKWVVINLIGYGLIILSGASKIGKSWLMEALTEAASTGGKFLGFYTVNKTPVLYLSLEDKEQDIKERRDILAKKQEGGFPGDDNLIIATEWKNGLEGLEAYLRAHNEIKFVIIDTLGQFMPDTVNMNDYTPAVKAMSKIKKLADSLDVAILVVHHTKKGSGKEENQGDWTDQSLGSQGIVASADTIIILQRDIEKTTIYYTGKDGKKYSRAVPTGNRLNTGKLYATGRGIKDTFHKVEFSPDFGMWGIINEGEKTPSKDQGSGNSENQQPEPKRWNPTSGGKNEKGAGRKSTKGFGNYGDNYPPKFQRSIIFIYRTRTRIINGQIRGTAKIVVHIE